MTRTELLAIMAASLLSGEYSNRNSAIADAEQIIREVESRPPQPDCLCAHAVPDFDGIHHDSRCALYKPDAEDIRSAALDECIAVCHEYGRTKCRTEQTIAAVGKCALLIEALKSRPSKEEK